METEGMATAMEMVETAETKTVMATEMATVMVTGMATVMATVMATGMVETGSEMGTLVLSVIPISILLELMKINLIYVSISMPSLELLLLLFKIIKLVFAQLENYSSQMKMKM